MLNNLATCEVILVLFALRHHYFDFLAIRKDQFIGEQKSVLINCLTKVIAFDV
jgi:hypothetical protein